MGILHLMKKNQKRTAFQSSGEMRFFLENNGLLSQIPQFSRLSKASEPFDIFRANVIIRALKNKIAIEEAYKNYLKEAKKGIEKQKSLAEAMVEAKARLPYLLFDGKKIFVPIFNSSINKFYRNETEALSNEAFSILTTSFDTAVIDPFDYYGSRIFLSQFSRLVRVGEKDGIIAFYSYDSLSIYIVNSSGRLDAEICLFDKYIKHPTLTHMMDRVVGVACAYLEGDKDKFIEELVDKKLISSNLICKYFSDKH